MAVKMPSYNGKLLILTGFEGTGRCYWCGKALPKNRKCYCSEKCMIEYYNHFYWNDAVRLALKEKKACEVCGSTEDLEVHHKKSLDGQYRMWNKLNQPDNLQVLCHKCHTEAHKKFKEKQRPQQMKLFLGKI